MKTNRFDEILRRKLESIQPDFQDQEWDKWQAFRQHATPTFWQTYGHWLGYAVATLTTAVMVVLYVNQSNQNQDLLNEMQALKQQVIAQNQASEEASTSATSGSTSSPEVLPEVSKVPRPDTVYVVEHRTVYVERLPRVEVVENSESTSIIEDSETEKIPDVLEKIGIANNQQEQENSLRPGASSPTTEEIARTNTPTSANKYILDSKTEAALPGSKNNRGSGKPKNSNNVASSQGTLPVFGSESQTENPMKVAQNSDLERLDLGEIIALPTPTYTRSSTNAYRRLQSRMPRPAKSKAPEQRVAQAENPTVIRQKPQVPASVQKVEKVAQDERLLPDFGLGLPFRVGVGQQWMGRTKALGVWNEILLGKHWSVQAGLSFQKLEDQKFYNDRIFRDKTHEDFRKEHAKPLPPSFDIFNITIRTTLTQIPLNLTYRGDLGHSFAYFAGVGTNLNLRAKQNLSFDFKLPTNDFGQQSAQRSVPFPLVNNVNVQVGAEKRWSPIVFQASLLLNNRLKTFPYLDDRTGLGIQVKVLYELGATKKK